jgi:uncharacterized protein (TIGR02231 family)
MKNLFLLIFLSFIFTANAQEIHLVNLNTKPQKIKVFLEGAQISRGASPQIVIGQNKLEFRQISKYVDPKSIQFKSDMPIDILSITIRQDFDIVESRNKDIAILKDSVLYYEHEIELLTIDVESLEAQELLLHSNTKFGGDNKISVEEIKQMSQFVEEKTKQIGADLLVLFDSINDLENKRKKVNKKLIERNISETRKGFKVVLLLDSKSAGTLNCELSYVVGECGWTADYDLRATDINQKVKLTYKAIVHNNTGIDWENVEISLSTGMPNLSADAPDLDPWYVDEDSYDAIDFRGSRNEGSSFYVDGIKMKGMEGDLEMKQTKDNETGVYYVDIIVSELSTTFDIENAYTIPSDFKPYFIQIGEYDIDATFHYLTVPKLEEKAFLQASVTGWESLNLIQGPANVYFGGVFVGRSEIETYLVEDTLNFSFGRDNKLIVSQKNVKEFSKKQTLGSNRKDTYAYEISVKNNRAGTVIIDVFDQVPVSNDNDIEINVNELSGGELSEYSGEVKWKLIIPPGGVKKVLISYTIKYPKGRKIRRGKYNKISSPRYF